MSLERLAVRPRGPIPELDGFIPRSPRQRLAVGKTLPSKNTVASIEGEEKKTFLEFVKRTIKWCPEERSTTREPLGNP